ncbi:MAG: peptidylprolyl isomerase [Ruminococcus sp.]|nr:peptidylprolyl isomerase [Ruminococcus sp.]
MTRAGAIYGGFRRIIAVAAAAAVLTVSGCGKELNISTSESREKAVQSGNTIVITLHPDDAPATCENFEELVNEGFYDGLTFHRVVEGFMAQGGDPNGNGSGGSSDTIVGEFASNGITNTLSHTRGVVSMARGNDPDSASSQFFICYSDNYASSLDGSYAAFGEVTEGMEVVDDFIKVERGLNSLGETAVPKAPIIMEKVEMTDPDENGSPRVKITMNDFLSSDDE